MLCGKNGNGIYDIVIGGRVKGVGHVGNGKGESGGRWGNTDVWDWVEKEDIIEEKMMGNGKKKKKRVGGMYFTRFNNSCFG